MVTFIRVSLEEQKEIKIDPNISIKDIRQLLELQDNEYFLKLNNKEMLRKNENKDAIRTIIQYKDDDEDTREGKVVIQGPLVKSIVSKHARLIQTDNKDGLKTYIYENKPEDRDKINAKKMIVIGGTGVGKTTLIDTIVNYVLGIKRHDEFRYRIIDDSAKDKAESITSEVAEYFIEETKFTGHTPIIIYDTPGFGDTKGHEHDEQNFNKIAEYLKKKIGYIHAVCFVGRAVD